MSTLTQKEIQVGDVAPDFTLPSTAGQPVSLSAFKGQRNVLLAFFPLAFTAVCTTEMCEFGSELDRFEQAGTKVLGVSVDATPSQKAFQKDLGFNTELLSDFKREVSRQYGVLLEDTFFSKRAYFLIDRQGVVRWRHIEAELGQRRENAEILAEIAKL